MYIWFLFNAYFLNLCFEYTFFKTVYFVKLGLLIVILMICSILAELLRVWEPAVAPKLSEHLSVKILNFFKFYFIF